MEKIQFQKKGKEFIFTSEELKKAALATQYMGDLMNYASYIIEDYEAEEAYTLSKSCLDDVFTSAIRNMEEATNQDLPFETLSNLGVDLNDGDLTDTEVDLITQEVKCILGDKFDLLIEYSKT